MTGWRLATVLTAFLLAQPVVAKAPDWSLPPRLAPASAANGSANAPAIRQSATASVGVAQAYPPRLRPGSAPAGATQLASATAVPSATGRSGAVCGDKRIQGETLPSFKGELAGCGITRPVRVSSISGIALSPSAVMSCDTARTTRAWIDESAKTHWGQLGGGLAQMSVAASYDCRTRNNQAGAPLSEHARGTAIDISAFGLRNGTTISVEKGWRDPLAGKVLRSIHQGGCKRFTTVLGPNADSFHRDHFHLDTARGRRVCK